jgi:hypothetical protein
MLRIILPLAIIVMMFSGCGGALTYLDGSTQDEINSFCTGEPKVKRNALGETPQEAQQSMLRDQLDEMTERNIAVNDTIRDNELLLSSNEQDKSILQRNINTLQKKIVELETEASKPSTVIAAVSDIDTIQKMETKTPVEVAAKVEAVKVRFKDVSIKVLSGDGNMTSAKSLSSKLKKHGFTIERIDLAPTSDFSKDTVFYAKKSVEDAKFVKEQLGKDAVMKPLTWKSKFDLIVVTKTIN